MADFKSVVDQIDEDFASEGMATVSENTQEIASLTDTLAQIANDRSTMMRTTAQDESALIRLQAMRDEIARMSNRITAKQEVYAYGQMAAEGKTLPRHIPEQERKYIEMMAVLMNVEQSMSAVRTIAPPGLAAIEGMRTLPALKPGK